MRIREQMHHSIQSGLLVALLVSTATTNLTDATASNEFLPGIAINAQKTHAYTAGADGRLIAIKLADGNVGWRSQRALEALGFYDATVIATAAVEDCQHCVQLIWISAADGREQRKSPTIAFPDWVSVEPAVGKQFMATVETIGTSLALHWKASSRYVGGAPPSSQVLADFKRDASGTFVIDAQGRAKPEEIPPKVTGAIPTALREVKTTTYWNCSEWNDVPVVNRDGMVAFELSSRPEGQTLSARRWRLPSGQLDTTRQLAQGSNLELQTSPDSKYLFIHDGALHTDPKASTSWHVYSLSTLRPVARILYPAGRTCANVVADTVVMLIEKSSPSNRSSTRSRELVGYAISNGELRWTVKLRGDPQQAHPR